LKADIPRETYKASRKIVDGQLDVKTKKPTPALSQMKDVKGTADLQLDSAKSLPIMDIHDSYNEPQLIEIEE